MPHYPSLRGQLTEQDVIDSFGGYDHRLRIRDGAWYDTRNLTSDFAPMPASRAARGFTHRQAAALLEKDALAYVSPEGTLYYNFRPTAVTGLSRGEKQLVGMGAYLLIFPDKIYFNTADESDWGSMEAHYRAQSAVYEMCRFDGSVIRPDWVQSSEPENPANAAWWIDTADEKHVLRQWSEAVGEWLSVESVYIRISFPTMGTVPRLFAVNDGVTIRGASVESVNGEKLIAALGGGGDEQDWILIPGLLEQRTEDGAITLERCVPELDFVCECQNRLWGCRYGLDENGEAVNEILCCALGDFRNWRQFAGLSTDSWRGAVGSDGQWTGAASYLGHPTFFKENRIHRVSVSAEGAHEISETVCRGVQKGSAKSLVVVNETLYYLSRSDVCAYQGGFPVGVSAELGGESLHDGVAGSAGGKYYLSVLRADGSAALFVYDIARSLWLREDETRVTQFARVDDELYAIADGEIITMRGSLPLGDSTREETIEWMAESGLLSYRMPENKRVSRYNLRLALAPDAQVLVEIEYDSDGVWRRVGEIRAAKGGCGSYLIPVRPHRCDHLRLRLTGSGEMKLYSIARLLEMGSDYR